VKDVAGLRREVTARLDGTTYQLWGKITRYYVVKADPPYHVVQVATPPITVVREIPLDPARFDAAVEVAVIERTRRLFSSSEEIKE
jgi:hypothetical protein